MQTSLEGFPKGIPVEQALFEVPNDNRLKALLLSKAERKDRSGDLYHLAAYLGELGVRPEAAISLIAYADKQWGKFSQRADWAERLAQLFVSYREKYNPQTFLQSLRPVTLQELQASTPEIEWAVEDLMAIATYGLISGATGVGKSTAAMQIGMTWAKGGEWNDLVFKKSRVLYASLEMGPHEILYFSTKLQTAIPLSEDETFHVLPIGQSVSVLTQEGRDFYLQYIDDYDVFMFDTVSSSTHLPMLDERTAPGIVSFFAELNNLGKTVLALGHDTKDAAKQGILRAEAMYGHRLLMDRASLIMRMEQEDLTDDERVAILFPKVRLAPKPKPLIYLKDMNTLILTKTTEEPKFLQGKGRAKANGKSVRRTLEDAGIDTKEIKDEWF